ncbi:MAG: N-acetyltransferase family protein [Salinivenus sp.]
MSSTVTVRPATVNDRDTLTRFNVAMAEETEDKPLDPDTVRAGVDGIFESPSRGFYLIAERDDRVVGSLMITPEWSDWRNGAFWWIQSVYVRPDARRTGVYTALHRDVRQRAAAKEEVCGLRLYVERGNEPARATYERLGMTQTSYRLYEESL